MPDEHDTRSSSDGVPPLPPNVIGWREWVGLPDLGIRRIKAKIDTGAKSSAIHAYNVRVFARGGTEIVKFDLHPRQKNERVVVSTEAEVLEFRKVRNSGGTVDTRPVIVTHAVLFGRRFPIELTLANRDEMGYRMLIGREALRGRFLINASESFLSERWPLGKTGPFEAIALEQPSLEEQHSIDPGSDFGPPVPSPAKTGPPLPRERGQG